jgi:hypothetical protein
MSPSRPLTRGAVLVLLAGTAACGVSSVAPKVELRDALGALTDAGGGSFTVSLPSSAEDVRAFLAAADEDDSSLDDPTLDALLGMELVTAYDGGESGKSTDDSGLVQLNIDGQAYGELRTVDEVGYLRIDVPELSERFPETAAGFDSLRGELDAQDLGSLEAAAEAALAGEWVSVDMAEDSWMAEQQKGMEGMPGQLPDDFGQRLLDLGGKALESSVSVRRSDDRLIATVNTRDLYSGVRDELPELLNEIAPGVGESLPPVSEVPDRDLSASFWVEDGELRRVELDLAQFLDEPTGHLVIRVDTADREPIEAPDGAVDVDLEQLAALTGVTPDQLFGGFAGAAGLDGEMDVEAAAMIVGAQFGSYAAIDGVAPTVEHLPAVAESFAGMTPPLELQAVGNRVQVTYDGEVACLTLAPGLGSEDTVATGPC